MNWIRNFIIRMLKIEPARNRRITIKEPFSFQTNVLKNKILYRGDPSEIEQFFKATAIWDVERTRFWASVSQGSVRKIHSGIVSTVIDRYKDIVMSDLDGIEITDLKAKETWKEIEKNNFFHTVEEAITGVLSTGDGAFKISTDENYEYPVVEFYDAEDIEIKELHGKTIEIKFYTTYLKDNKEFRLEENYGRGFVKYKLFDDAGREVPLNSLNETKDLVDIQFRDDCKDYMLAVPFKIFTSNKYKGRGKALFDSKTDVIDALDEVISQWLDAVRLGRIKRYIPEDLIPKDPETGKLMPANPFDNDFIAVQTGFSENGKSEINISQPQILYEAYVNSYCNYLDMVLQGIISPSTLGIDLKKTDNSESQREKEKVTLHVRNKIVDTLNEVIPSLVGLILNMYQMMQGKSPNEYEVSVQFGEYASPDFDSTVETIAKARQAGIMSTEKAVDELYGDSMTEEEKAEEVARLKMEQGIVDLEEPAVNLEGVDTEEGSTGTNLLNGAQIASLMNVIKMVKEGSVTRNEAISIITATLGISKENAESFIEEGMSGTIKSKSSKEDIQNESTSSKKNIPNVPKGTGRTTGNSKRTSPDGDIRDY